MQSYYLAVGLQIEEGARGVASHYHSHSSAFIIFMNQPGCFFSINRCLVCQAAAQLHAVKELLKQQWLIWWIFKIKCFSVNHRFHAMEILSKMFRFEAKVIPKRQSMTIFCNLSRWLCIKNPFAPACLVVTAMLKSGILIFLFSRLQCTF